MTSEQTPVMWPLIAGDGLPPTGAPMGFNVLSGGSFYCDPMGWVNDDTIAVTNPNVFIFGKPGRGKSALVKAFMLRMIRFGYRSLVLGDIKDEYEDISRALGVEPYRIGPGLPGRINPLDFGPLALDWEQPGPRRDRPPRRGHVQPLAGPDPRPRRLPGRPVHPDREPGDQPGAARPHRLGPRPDHAAPRSPSRWCGPPWTTRPRSWSRDCRYESRQDFFDGTRPLRDALGRAVRGRARGPLRRTLDLRSRTGAPRSRRCR